MEHIILNYQDEYRWSMDLISSSLSCYASVRNKRRHSQKSESLFMCKNIYIAIDIITLLGNLEVLKVLITHITMKTKFLILIFLCVSLAASSQSMTKQNGSIHRLRPEENQAYELFPTKNHWTFIKLDTRNGRMWQVHFSVSDEGAKVQVILNSRPLVNMEDEVPGRFKLHATENIYNYILLDQIDGAVYQVQWSMDEKYRGVVPIN